jgi:hypothetical protein
VLDRRAIAAAAERAILASAHSGNGVGKPNSARDQYKQDHRGDRIRDHAATISVGVVIAVYVLVDCVRPRNAAMPRRSKRKTWPVFWLGFSDAINCTTSAPDEQRFNDASVNQALSL